MDNLLPYLLKSGTCLLAFYLLYAFVLQREKCFTYNRFYLLVSPVLALILPLLELPSWHQAEPLPVTSFVTGQLPSLTPPPIPKTATVNVAYPEEEVPTFDWSILLMLSYLTGAGFFIYRLGRQLYRLRQFKQQTQTGCFYWQGILVHQTNGGHSTFSFGNCIYWDNSQSLTSAETEQILLHESVHVRQKHSLDLIYLELLKSIFWFNPLLYLYQKALVQTHEFIADAAVLRFTRPGAYANLLVNQVLHRLEFSFSNYFNKSLVLSRLEMLEQTRQPNFWKQLLALPVLSILLFFLSSSNLPLQETAESPRNQASSNFNVNGGNFPKEQFSEPLFPGGKTAMYRFFAQNLKYPAQDISAEARGYSMYFLINIDEKGNIKIPRYSKNSVSGSATYSLVTETAFDKEIQRVLELLPPRWTPAKINNRPVASRYAFNFSFLKINPAEELGPKKEKEEYEWDIAKNPVIFTRTIQIVLYDKNIPLNYKANSPTITYHNPKTVFKSATSNLSLILSTSELTYDNKIQLPLFPGGRKKMIEYLHQNIRFNKHIHFLGNNESGAFTNVEIRIDEQGKVAPVTSILDDAFAQDINQAIQNMPNWEPAEVDGQPTAATYNLTLAFKKESEEYTAGSLSEKLEEYKNGELKINAVLFGKKAYTVNNNPNEPVLTAVAIKPEFPGGMGKMYDFLNKHLKYPPRAKEAKLEGMVQAKFIVTKEGKIVEPTISEHLSPEMDVEFLRVIKLMPTWNLGKQKGKPINAEYKLPFKFRLDYTSPKN